jgi:hypothetical protein
MSYNLRMRLIDRLALRVRSGRPFTDMSGPLEDSPPPPVGIADIAAAEARLGLAFPQLLRDIYLRVGNGGFGPGYGLFGIEAIERVLPDIHTAAARNFDARTEKILAASISTASRNSDSNR